MPASEAVAAEPVPDAPIKQSDNPVEHSEPPPVQEIVSLAAFKRFQDLKGESS